MPLIHQDTSRAGGGVRPRSLVDFLGFEPPRATELKITSLRTKELSEWRWEPPRSPPCAHSPRSLVPSACFPPRHTASYASFSESARPGSGSGSSWDKKYDEEDTHNGDVNHGDTDGQINDLAISLKALTGPSTQNSESQASGQGSIPDTFENNLDIVLWTSEPVPRDDRYLNRRASFCGTVSRSNGVVRWCGVLPPRGAAVRGYSPKVFVGGLPWDISETALLNALQPFQPTNVEWPGREQAGGSPRGFAYVTFHSESCVRALLAACRCDNGDLYYKIASRKMRSKEAQVIPWMVEDATWMQGLGSARLEPARTVFVGALHGMLSAAALAHIMNDLFQGVIYAGIDTDKNKYPIGSGRVTFSNVHSYVRAISANYVEIHTDKFTKKVQVDPYLEDSMCSVCNLHQGPYFCRVPVCFRYFCRSCWVWKHPADEHKPLMRLPKPVSGHPRAPRSPPATGPGSPKAITEGPFNGLSNGMTTGPTTNGPLTNGLSNGRMTNGLSNDYGPMTNGLSNDYGPMSNGLMSNGPMSNGPMSNGPMSNGPMSNGPMSNGPMSNGPMSNGPMSNGPITNGPMSNGPMSNGPMSNGPMSNGPMTNGPMSNGPTNGPMSSGGSSGYQSACSDFRGRKYSDDSGSPPANGVNHTESEDNIWR